VKRELIPSTQCRRSTPMSKVARFWQRERRSRRRSRARRRDFAREAARDSRVVRRWRVRRWMV